MFRVCRWQTVVRIWYNPLFFINFVLLVALFMFKQKKNHRLCGHTTNTWLRLWWKTWSENLNKSYLKYYSKYTLEQHLMLSFNNISRWKPCIQKSAHQVFAGMSQLQFATLPDIDNPTGKLVANNIGRIKILKRKLCYKLLLVSSLLVHFLSHQLSHLHWNASK